MRVLERKLKQGLQQPVAPGDLVGRVGHGRRR